MTKRLLTTQKIVNLSSDPVSGVAGEVYYNTVSNKLKFYNQSTWTEVGGGSGSSVTISDSSPSSPAAGDLWYQSTTGFLFIRYDSFWIQVGGGGNGPDVSINTQTTSYTTVLADAGRLIEMNSASSNNLTVPPSSSVSYAVGTSIDIVQYGAGQTTVVAGSGVTIRSAGGLFKLSQQYASATLYKRGTDEWVLIGDLA